MAWTRRRAITLATVMAVVTSVEGARTSRMLKSVWKALAAQRGLAKLLGWIEDRPAANGRSIAAPATPSGTIGDDDGNGSEAPHSDDGEAACQDEGTVMKLGAPREYGRATQVLMKHICRITFNRATVAFFAAAPLRLRSLCYYDASSVPGVRGHVAITLDDAPCRGEPHLSEMRNVLDVLRRYGAKATFMLVGAFAKGHEEDLVEVLKSGHELGNHGMHDRRYDQDSKEDFGEAVDACTKKIKALQRTAGVPQGVRWFRAPHGKYTRTMEDALVARGLENVMCDTYASCPIIQDGEFIGDFLAENARDGSIILLHMPERNFRTWCSVGLARLLEGLSNRGLKAVTLTELSELAKASAPN